ncbi:hypothetical protein D3C87_785430 [compost metagenome]
MMPTMISAGTPYSRSARASASAFSSQNFTPALMRTGSMKRALYACQFFGLPGGAGFISCTVDST